MEDSYRERYYRLEEVHWWGIARRDFIRRLLDSFEISKDGAVIDVGCSSGPLVEHLQKAGFRNVHGVDISELAVSMAHRRGMDTVRQMEATKLGFSDSYFDAIVASDIIEHLRDEREALAEWSRVLKPQGKLIVFAPAFEFLWSEHDVANRHFRRYTGGELRNALLDAGFSVDRLAYWNSAIFLPAAGVRVAKKLLPRAWSKTHDLRENNSPLLNSLLARFMLLENRVLDKWYDAPVGVSVYAIATKT